MTPEQGQEEVSKAYVHAVAARCGFAIASWSQDHGGIDTTISAAAALGSGTLARPKVDLQLKATTQQGKVHAEYVSWTLAMPHYDALRAEPAMCPHLLVVLVLPDDFDDSVEHTVEHLIVRRCAYWVKMTGMPPATGASQTVRVPLGQVLSPAGLQDILTRISEGTF
jgi:hypothetical protein